MAVLTHLETDTGTNTDISSATAVGAYTSTGDKLIMVDVSIDAVAGNGDYVMYVTRQIGGSGSAYRILPQTTMAAASGLTAISAQSGWITVRNGDVLTCYVDGLAGDTSTPDWSTRWFELAGVTAAAVADAVWDEATADHTTASSFGALDANVDAILDDTGTDGVVLKAAGLADDAVAEIADGVWVHDIRSYGVGEAGGDLLYWLVVIAGYLNEAGRIDLLINAIKAKTDNLPASPANEATLTAIKGAGWTNETLVKIVTDIAAISAGIGATAQEVWEYATRVLTAGTNIDLSALATATDLATVDTVVDAIKAKTDNLPADPAAVGSAMTLTAAYDKAKDDVLTPLAVVDSIVDGLKTTLDNIHDTDLPAVKTETAAIKAKTDNLPASPASAGEYTAAIAAIPTTPLLAVNYTAPDNAGIAAIKARTDLIPDSPAETGEYTLSLEDISAAVSHLDDTAASNVWSYGTRTLTYAIVGVTAPTIEDELTLMKYSTIYLTLTGLGSLTNKTNMWFTMKEQTEARDQASLLQVDTTTGLLYLNSLTVDANNYPTLTAADVHITVDDAAAGDITIRIDQEVAELLPTFEAYPVVWDCKVLNAGDVVILAQGTAYIKSTSTHTLA